MDKNTSSLTENVLYSLKNGLLEDETGKAILDIFKAGVCDDVIAGMFERRASNHRFRQMFYDTVPYKTPRLMNGDYILGIGDNRKELRSFIQFLNAHSLTVAGSGAGKTTVSYFKILQIVPCVSGTWLFDLQKREFGILKPYLSKVGADLIILPGRFLKMNPLQLPIGVEVSDWLPRVADMLIEVLELPSRASKLLQATLFPLYRKFESQDLFPTLYDLFEQIKDSKNANHQARIAILDSLEPILLSLGPKVLAYRQGWSTEMLADKRICFELAGLSEVDKNLMLNSLILSEFTSRIARGISNPKMNLWICIDEAQRLYSSSSRTSAIASQIGLVRGTGIGLDLSLQSIDGVLAQIISNTATKVLGRCGSMTDYAVAGRSMGLNAEQIQWAQMTLEPGLFICQLSEGKWRQPFVFRIPPMNFPKTTAKQTHTDNNLLSDLATIYATEFDKWGMEYENISSQTSVQKESLFTRGQEYQFCKAVASHPMQPSSTYPKLAGISPKSAKQVRTQLVLKNYIREHTLDSGSKGRSSILLEALPAGIEAIRKYEEKS